MMAQPESKMKNVENSFRTYNRQVYRSKVHLFTKKYIDNKFYNAMYDRCEVSLVKITTEAIDKYKLSLVTSTDSTSPKEDGNTFKDDGNTFKDDNTSKINKKSKVVKSPKDKNTSIDSEPAKKKQKLDTDGIDVLKLVLSREGETDKFKAQFKSSLKPNKEIASTSTEEVVPIEIDCEESTEPTTSSTKDIKKRISVIDPKKMMTEELYARWLNITLSDKTFKHPINGMKKLTVVKPSTSGPLQSTKVNEIKHPLNNKNHVKGNLIEIEKFYKKYFSKSVQDTIVIIANILNIISMSNKHHKARMDESFKKKSEAEKLKERCDANRLHGRHKKILETKLKTNFIEVVSSFEESEFDSAFQMFFLSILTVLRVLDQPKFRKGSIFKNLVLLLWNSLKNSDYNHPKIFSMFRSKTFRPDCIDLISLIEDSRDVDPGVTDRMSLFFVSTVNSREYFQAVINAVTSDSNEDLALLIDNATFQCRVNSKFNDPVDSSSDKLVTETIPKINSAETIQHWFLAKNPDGTFQQIPLLNGNRPQTIGNTAVAPPIITSQPLNNFYESFSTSLQKKPAETSTSQMIPAKKCIVVTPNISNSPMVQAIASSSQTATSTPTPTPTPTTTTTTTYVTFKPPIQSKNCMPNNLVQRPESSTILLGNKQYQLVNGSGAMRAVVNGTNILVKPSPSNINKCFARNCKNPATIMCSSCTSVKYCSSNCQRRDWYDSHINDCDQLINRRQAQP